MRIQCGPCRASLGKIEASYIDFDTWTPKILLAKTHMHSENSADGVETDSTTGDRTTMTFSNNFDLALHHSLNATAEHEVQKFKQRGAPPQDQKIKTTSAAGEYQYGIEKFLLSVSGRYDDNDAFDNSFVYRAGALYRFETWRLFGSYGTGSKNPTFSERFGFAPEFFLGNPDLEPEQSRGYEIGAGTTWRAVDVSITGFSSRLENEINGFVFDADSGFFTAENVDGTSRRKGGELAVRANLNSLSVDASYSYVDATEDGTAEIRRPKHLGRIQVTGLIVPTLRFNVGVTYTGKQIDIDFGTFTRVTLSDYRLLSAGLAWRPRHNVTLHLQGENLANVKYQDIFGYANPSRTIIMGVGIEL